MFSGTKQCRYVDGVWEKGYVDGVWGDKRYLMLSVEETDALEIWWRIMQFV